jgi:hypothetical protein
MYEDIDEIQTGVIAVLYGKYRFSSVFEDDAVLPEYKGSAFRGIFGQALKHVVCALKRQDCRECLLRQKCLYATTFEAFADNSETSARKRIAVPPHPYVIEPPYTTQTRYQKGEDFHFDLLLFGAVIEQLPYFIYAVDQMEKIGMGKCLAGKRATFKLLSVTSHGATVYTKDTGRVNLKSAFVKELKLLPATSENQESEKAIEVNIISPLRLKHENRLEATLPFHILVRAMLRRVSALLSYFDEGEPPLDYRGLVGRAREVDAVSSLRWIDWRRYSNRQEREMLMGGIVGKIIYKGNLCEYMPLLRFCEEVHLGKQSSFGLGKISITEITP